MKFFVLVAVFAVAAANDAYNRDSYKKEASYEKKYEEEYPAQPYSFGYDVKDKESYNDFEHSEKADGKVVSGSYRVALPDGRVQIVNYKADDYGNVAEVKYEGEAKYPEYVERPYKAASYAAPSYKAPEYKAPSYEAPVYKAPAYPKY